MNQPTRTQIVAALRGTRLLRAAKDKEIEELAGVVRSRSLEENAAVFAKNAEASSVYVLMRGRIRISSIGRGGDEFLIGMVEAGEMFGELALIEDSRRAVSALAEVDSTFLSIGRRELWSVLERNPACMMAAAKVLASHLRITLSKLESVALHDAKRRLWSRIISLGRRYGREGSQPGSLRVQHGLSQEELASTVGLTRVMVSRQLSLWREMDLVVYGRGFIEIRDPDTLERFIWDGSSGESGVSEESEER